MGTNPFIKLAKNDEYFTPNYAIKPILEFIEREWIVWCPFDTKNSEFVRIFNKNGNKVIYSHLKNKNGNFFNGCKEKYDVIVSNPPFSKKFEILRACLITKKPFGLLFGAGIFNLTKLNRLVLEFDWDIQILAFTERITYTGKTPSFASVYICNKLLNRPYVVKEISKKDFSQSEMIKDNLKNLIQPSLFEEEEQYGR